MIKLKQSKDGQWYFIVVAKNGRTLLTSETYKKRISAEKGIRAAVKVFNSIDGNKEIFTFAVNK